MAKLKNEQHELLVQEYLVDLNQTQAAIRAGYSPKSANQQASVLFAKPNIRARVEEFMAERSARTGVNADRVVRELARLAFVDPTRVFDAADATLQQGVSEDDRAAIASVKVKTIPTQDGEGVEREIKLCDKLKALELLGKHLGMFTDRLDIASGVSITFEEDYGGGGDTGGADNKA